MLTTVFSVTVTTVISVDLTMELLGMSWIKDLRFATLPPFSQLHQICVNIGDRIGILANIHSVSLLLKLFKAQLDQHPGLMDAVGIFQIAGKIFTVDGGTHGIYR